MESSDIQSTGKKSVPIKLPDINASSPHNQSINQINKVLHPAVNFWKSTPIIVCLFLILVSILQIILNETLSTTASPNSNNNNLRLLSEVVKSVNNPNQYYFQVLGNGMKVLLITSNDTEKSGAALSVRVGSYLDPDDFQGISHFLEHLLFMGSKKYPEENMFNALISQGSGYTNAYTDVGETRYFFECANNLFNQALDVWGNMIVDPSLQSDSLNREIEAIESEFVNSLSHTGFRKLYLLQLINQGRSHPFNSFLVGNLKSLFGSQQRILEPSEAQEEGIYGFIKHFYKSHYQPENMVLTVFTNQEMLQSVASTIKNLFGSKKQDTEETKSAPKKTVPGSESGSPVIWPPFADENLGILVKSKEKSEMDELTVLYQLTSLSKVEVDGFYLNDSLHFVTNAIQVLFEENLQQRLEDQRLITSMKIEENEFTSQVVNFRFLEITFQLTEHGKSNIRTIIQTLNQYLTEIRQSNNLENLFNEMRQVNELQFKYEQDIPSLLQHAMSQLEKLQFFNHSDAAHERNLLAMKPETPKFNAVEVAHILSELDHRKAIYIVRSHAFEPYQASNASDSWLYDFLSEASGFIQNPDFKMEFAKVKLTPEQLNSFQAAVPSEPSQFRPTLYKSIAAHIPVNFALNPQEGGSASAGIPELLERSAFYEVFHLNDVQFAQPKYMVRMNFVVPRVQSNLEDYLRMQLLLEQIDQNLKKKLKEHLLVSTSYQILPVRTGFELTVSGYNEKVPAVMEAILAEIRNVEISESEFKYQREKLKSSYEQMLSLAAFRQAAFYLKNLLELDAHTIANILEVIPRLCYSDLSPSNLLRHHYLQVFFYGNIKREDVLSELTLIRPLLRQPDEAPQKLSFLDLGGRSVTLREKIQFHNDGENSVCLNYYQFGAQLPLKEVVVLQLGQFILYDQLFDELRTKQQLGYVVTSFPLQKYNVSGLCIVVQGFKEAPDTVNERIREFLEGFKGWVQNEMSDEQFRKIVEGQIKVLKNKDTSMDKVMQRFWTLITEREYNFRIQQDKIALMESITKKEFQEITARLLGAPSMLSLQLFNSEKVGKERTEPEQRPGVFARPADLLSAMKAYEREI